MSFCLIILAGGNSHRFRSKISKPYQKIAGKSLIEIIVLKAQKFKQIKKIVVVYNKKDLKRIKFLKLKKVKLIDDDFNNINHYKKKIKKISFAYVDCDLYEETLKILNFIDHKITKGGIIAFDEALRNTKKGEAKALKEFYQTRKKETEISESIVERDCFRVERFEQRK